MWSNDILRHIIGFLPVRELAYVQWVSKQWKAVRDCMLTRRAKQEFALVASPCLLRFITKHSRIMRSPTYYLKETVLERVKAAAIRDSSVLSFTVLGLKCSWQFQWSYPYPSHIPYKLSELITPVQIFCFHDSILATSAYVDLLDIHVQASKICEQDNWGIRGWLMCSSSPRCPEHMDMCVGFGNYHFFHFSSSPFETWISNVDTHPDSSFCIGSRLPSSLWFLVSSSFDSLLHFFPSSLSPRPGPPPSPSRFLDRLFFIHLGACQEQLLRTKCFHTEQTKKQKQKQKVFFFFFFFRPTRFNLADECFVGKKIFFCFFFFCFVVFFFLIIKVH